MEPEHAAAVREIGNRGPVLRQAIVHHTVPGDGALGAPMSWKLFPFLVELYASVHKLDELVIQKCTQVGWTELFLVFGVWYVGTCGRRFAYVLPDDRMIGDFVQEKVQPMFDRIPKYGELDRLADRRKRADNLRLRQFGHGSWRFVGTRQQSKLRSFTADAVCVDEVDDCTQGHLGLVRDRIRQSRAPLKQLFWLGNPTLPNDGISKLYQASDRRRWYHTCGRCGERQALDWWVHIVERAEDGGWVPRDRQRAAGLRAGEKNPSGDRDIRPVCRRCHKPFARTSDGQGCAWVAENSEHARRGYHVSQLDVPDRRIWDLFVEYLAAVDDSERMRQWWAGVLGLAYEPSGAKVTVEELQRSMVGTENDPDGGESYDEQTVTCGVDVGAFLNVVVSVIERRTSADEEEVTVRRAVWVGAVRTFEDLDEVLDRYRVDVGVIDSMPEIHEVEKLIARQRAKGRVIWACNFHPKARVGKERFAMTPNDVTSVVTVSKTPLLDAALSDIRTRTREFPQDAMTVLGFMDQMRQPVRVLKETPSGLRFVWDRKGKADHYRLADSYDLVAYELRDFRESYFEIDMPL